MFEKFVLSKSCSIVQIVAHILFDVGALLLGFGSLGVVVVDLAVTTVIRLFMVLYVICRMHLAPSFKNLSFRFVKGIFSFSSFVFLQQIATQVSRMTGQVLLGMLVENASVIIAIYSVGIQIVNYSQNIAGSINSVLMPGVVRLVEKMLAPHSFRRK